MSVAAKQPLGERCANIPSPQKSPSKVPLPPSPVKQTDSNTLFAERTGPMDQVFKASSISQKPDLIRKVAESQANGQAYISPSDNIQSPTTKRLTEVKNRRYANLKKSSSLYKSSNLFGGSLMRSSTMDEQA